MRMKATRLITKLISGDNVLQKCCKMKNKLTFFPNFIGKILFYFNCTRNISPTRKIDIHASCNIQTNSDTYLNSFYPRTISLDVEICYLQACLF